MIKAQAFKEPQRQSQPSRQDYVFEEKQKGNFGPFAFLAVLTGFAVYLKSFLATANEPAPEQRKSPSQKAADDGIAQGSADEGPATEAPPRSGEGRGRRRLRQRRADDSATDNHPRHGGQFPRQRFSAARIHPAEIGARRRGSI